MHCANFPPTIHNPFERLPYQDIHAHFYPESYLQLIADEGVPFGATCSIYSVLNLHHGNLAAVTIISTRTLGSNSDLPMHARAGRFRSPSQAFHFSFMAGFNFSGLIDIAHIKRVVFTSPTREKNGKKDSLDPFLPFDPTKGKGLVTAKKLNNTLNLMHIDFINYVKEGREHDPNFKPNQSSDLFSGDFWVGSESVKNGLTDHIGDLYTTAKKEFKTEHFVEYRPHFSIFDRFLASAETSLKSASIEISHKTPPLAMTP